MMHSPRPTRALSRLLYTSKSAIEAEGDGSLATIRGIAKAAARKNQTADLTGGLLYIDDRFIQVLEGPATNVESLFEQICCDLRHRDVTLIEVAPVASRLFGEWQMAFLSDSEDVSAALHGDLGEIQVLLRVNAREAQRKMRKVLVDNAAPVGAWTMADPTSAL